MSLIGVPLRGGFCGEFYIFKVALEQHLIWLRVLGLLNNAVAALYYPSDSRSDVYARARRTASEAEPISPGLVAALIPPALATLLSRIYPTCVLSFPVESNATSPVEHHLPVLDPLELRKVFYSDPRSQLANNV